MASEDNDALWMEEDGPKNEAEILERIATLYAQLDDVREKQRRDEAPGGDKASSRGPRVVLVTRRLPRDALDETKPKVDAMDQALCNFRQVTSAGRDVKWVGRPEMPTTGAHDGDERTIRERLLREGRYAPVFLDAKKERLFYSGYCKRVLWPLFHSSPPTTRDVVARARQPPIQGHFCPFYKGDDDESADTRQLWQAYVSVNRAYADVVHDVAEEGDLIWIQDYHFMLLPQMLRALDTDAKLGFFLHVPFPSSELYRMLPYREEILHGLLAADLLGFQTYDYARHFLSSCEIILGIETSPDRIEHDGHQTRVCVCPVGIEPEAVRTRAKQTSTTVAIQRLESQLSGRTLVLGVDTLDPTKGLVHKFLAIEELFNEHPELADQIMFVQVILGGASAVPDEEESSNQAMAARHYDTLPQDDDDDVVGSDDDTVVANDDTNDFLQQQQQHHHFSGGNTSTRWHPGAPLAASSRGGGGTGVPLDATSSGRPPARLPHHTGPRTHSHGLFYASSNSSSTDLSGSARRSQAHGAAGRPKERLERAHRRYYARGVFTTLERQLHAMVSRINSKLASLDFEGPVQYLNVAHPEADEDNLAALFSLADILVCTPIRDGMNVVPFEYLVARDAVGKFATVLLSEFAGCARSLGGAVLINPWDTTNFANVLHRLVKEARTANARDARRRAAKRIGSSGSKTSSSARLDVGAAATSSETLNERSSSSSSKSTRRAAGTDLGLPTGLVDTSSGGNKLKQHGVAMAINKDHSFLSEVRASGRQAPSRPAAAQAGRVSSQAATVDASDDDTDDDDDDDGDEEDDDDDDEDEVVHKMVPPSGSLVDVDDDGTIPPEGVGRAAQTSSLAARLPRSSTQRSRGVERRRAHEHMLQYVSTFTARSWADRFLHQLQEASETKASRTLCREIKVSQLAAPYSKTKRRLLVFALEGVLAKPCALPELLVVPPQTLESLRAICRDDANRMVVIMSARQADVLERLFFPILADGDPPTNLVLAAEEGLAIKWGPTLPFEMQVSAFDVDLSWQVDASPLIEYYTERTPGSVVEKKESGVAWHYRDCDLNHGAWQARQLQVALGELAKHVPLSVFSGDKCIEVRPMRLNVPNVLEAALRRIRKGDAAESREDADFHGATSTIKSPTSADGSEHESPIVAATTASDRPSISAEDAHGDVVVPDTDTRRGIDFVLFVASGNGLVDEEIFESMAPPPFDLDEFCFRMQKLSEGEKLEDVVVAPASAMPNSGRIEAETAVEAMGGASERAKPAPRPTRARSFSFDFPPKRDKLTQEKAQKLRSPSVEDVVGVSAKERQIADPGVCAVEVGKECSYGYVEDRKFVEGHVSDSRSDHQVMRRFQSVSSPLAYVEQITATSSETPRKLRGTPSLCAEEVETLTSAPDGTFDGERIKGALSSPTLYTEQAPTDKTRLRGRPSKQKELLQTQTEFGSTVPRKSAPRQDGYETDLGPEAAIFEQYAALMTEPEIDRKKAIPDQFRERLKRKKSSFVKQTVTNPAAPPQPSAQPESQSDSLRRANVAARQDFQPRRDFPPSAMLFQAIRRRYGRDWSRVDIPTTASACWALVEGRTPRPGAPKAERSTFLADFEDIHGVHSPDVVLPHQVDTFDKKEAYVEPCNRSKRSASQPPRIRRVESVGDCEDEVEKSDVPPLATFSHGFAKVVPKSADLAEFETLTALSAQGSQVNPPGRSDVDGSDASNVAASMTTNGDMHLQGQLHSSGSNRVEKNSSQRMGDDPEPDLKSASVGDDDKPKSGKILSSDKVVDLGDLQSNKKATVGLAGSSPMRKNAVGRQLHPGGTVLDHAVEMNALALSRALMRNQITDEDKSVQQMSPRFASPECANGLMSNGAVGVAQQQQSFRQRSHRSYENLCEPGQTEGSHHHRTGSWDNSYGIHMSPPPTATAPAMDEILPHAQIRAVPSASLEAVPLGNDISLDGGDTTRTDATSPTDAEQGGHYLPLSQSIESARVAGDAVVHCDPVQLLQDCRSGMNPGSSAAKHGDVVDPDLRVQGTNETFGPRFVDTSNTVGFQSSSTIAAAQQRESSEGRSAKIPRKTVLDESATQPYRWRLHNGWEAPIDQSTISSQRISRLRTRTVTPPPPGATPMYLSHASRGAMTEQERREFDRAGRVASAAAKASLQRETAPVSMSASVAASTIENSGGDVRSGVGSLSGGPRHLSGLISRPGTMRFSSTAVGETAEPLVEHSDEDGQMNSASETIDADSVNVQTNLTASPIAKIAESSQERHRSSRANLGEPVATTVELGETMASDAVQIGPLSPVMAPDRSEPPPPPMASLAAAAAAAADDSYVGLDLPLQTFSCTVGIKLSQATYYLKSPDMVLAWLDQIGSASAVSSPKSKTNRDM